MVVCPTDSLQTPHNNDDVSSYMSNVLGMGLFAWDMEDAIREGDGERMIRLWMFLLLLFKQAGKTKYSLEAMHLLFDVAECVAQLDKLIHIKRDSGYHAEPLHDQDRQAIFQQLVMCLCAWKGVHPL